VSFCAPFGTRHADEKRRGKVSKWFRGWIGRGRVAAPNVSTSTRPFLKSISRSPENFRSATNYVCAIAKEYDNRLRYGDAARAFGSVWLSYRTRCEINSVSTSFAWSWRGNPRRGVTNPKTVRSLPCVYVYVYILLCFEGRSFDDQRFWNIGLCRIRRRREFSIRALIVTYDNEIVHR